jgi:hypothetical protein
MAAKALTASLAERHAPVPLPDLAAAPDSRRKTCRPKPPAAILISIATYAPRTAATRSLIIAFKPLIGKDFKWRVRYLLSNQQDVKTGSEDHP